MIEIVNLGQVRKKVFGITNKQQINGGGLGQKGIGGWGWGGGEGVVQKKYNNQGGGDVYLEWMGYELQETDWRWSKLGGLPVPIMTDQLYQ